MTSLKGLDLKGLDQILKKRSLLHFFGVMISEYGDPNRDVRSRPEMWSADRLLRTSRYLDNNLEQTQEQFHSWSCSLMNTGMAKL